MSVCLFYTETPCPVYTEAIAIAYDIMIDTIRLYPVTGNRDLFFGIGQFYKFYWKRQLRCNDSQCIDYPLQSLLPYYSSEESPFVS